MDLYNSPSLKKWAILDLGFPSFRLDFESFLEGYVNFDCMRQLKGSSPRGSGGITVFVNCVCQRLSCRWKYYKTCL